MQNEPHLLNVGVDLNKRNHYNFSFFAVVARTEKNNCKDMFVIVFPEEKHN